MDYKQTDWNRTEIATWENGFIVKQDDRDFDLSINSGREASISADATKRLFEAVNIYV